jgi:hypothetical protein
MRKEGWVAPPVRTVASASRRLHQFGQLGGLHLAQRRPALDQAGQDGMAAASPSGPAQAF